MSDDDEVFDTDSAFYAWLALMVALELIEWPIGLMVGVGHWLARRWHRRVLRQLREAKVEA